MEFLLGLTVGVLMGAAAGFLVRSPRRSDMRVPTPRELILSKDAESILAAVPAASVVVDSSGSVVRASPQAQALSLVTQRQIAIPEVTSLISEARRAGEIVHQELTVRRPPLGRGLLALRLQVAPLGGGKAVLVLAEDLSEARRVDAVRRDFVANVSHELKTPIGALSLLAEAVQSAADEPDSVRHFASRMEAEADRLSALVSDLIDLSRLQGADPLKESEAVSVDSVVAEAVDATRMVALRQEMDIVVGGSKNLRVLGVESQLITALRNLLTNAVTYSPRGTRVAVGTRYSRGVVEISVTDQGMGIPESELDRVFERFYRVDQARSRNTGGTGLGLAIVKHVCENHGGEVSVWSVVGEGSTFTLRLPPYREIAMDTGDLLAVEGEHADDPRSGG